MPERSEIIRDLKVRQKRFEQWVMNGSPAQRWAHIARHRPPRTAEVIGIKCADVNCYATDGITFDKPLCYRSWIAFDAYEIEECPSCHWFTNDPDIDDDGDFICFPCMRGEDVPVYPHGPVKRAIRYLYILKLDGGDFYIGQTNSLEVRLQEHRDGVAARTTKGKTPQLVWFQKWTGNRAELNEAEDALTLLAKERPRAIRRMVLEWQRLLKLVRFEE